MACTPPLTQSLGFAFFDYTTQNGANQHRARVRLVYPVDPADITVINTAMDILTNNVQVAVAPSVTIIGWGTMTPDGTVFHIAAYSPAKVGTHSAAALTADFLSKTVTFTGKGFPVSAATCAGQTRLVLYVGNTYANTPGQKYITSGTDAALDDIQDFLSGNSIIGGDFYGNVGNWRPRYPVQFNAYTQRHKGT